MGAAANSVRRRDLCIGRATAARALLHMHIVAEAGRAIVTPAIHWLEEKDGRRLLEFPAYLRRVLSRLAALSDGQVDDFPETCAYAKSAGIGLDVVRDRLGCRREDPLVLHHQPHRLHVPGSSESCAARRPLGRCP